MFVAASTAAQLEAAQAYRATNYARAVLPKVGVPPAAVISIAGAQVVYAGPGLPVNRAIGLGMDGPVTTDDLAAIEGFYRARRTEAVVDLCPLADPSLFAALSARGYRPLRAMTMLVAALPHAAAAVGGITVTRCQADEQEQWLALSVRGFGDGERVVPELRDLLAPNVRAEGAAAYFAWLGDEPIATAGLYRHGAVAELGGASTLPAFRRLGAQTALIAQRLEDAAAGGCRYAVVLTAPGSESQRNLQARGFQVAYTRLICGAPMDE